MTPPPERQGQAARRRRPGPSLPTTIARLPAGLAGFVAGSLAAGLLGYRVDWLPVVGGAGWDWEAATLAAVGGLAALGFVLGVLPDDAPPAPADPSAI